jgi:hypothetical protein
MTDKNLTIISIIAEKAPDRIQHLLIIETSILAGPEDSPVS